MLLNRLDIPLDDLVILTDRPIEPIVADLLDVAVRVGWVRDLLKAVYEDRPRNQKLAALYSSAGIGPTVEVTVEGARPPDSVAMAGSGAFEAMISAGGSPLDIVTWTEAFDRIQHQVCRVEMDGRAVGTGFLVGPETVLTCYNVLASLIANSRVRSTVLIRFDHMLTTAGLAQPSLEVGLAYDWLVDWSPSTSDEAVGRPTPAENSPDPDKLDHAIVRLERPVGLERVGPDTSVKVRGWVWIPKTPQKFSLDIPVLIPQYPQEGALKLAIDTRGIIGLIRDGTRVRYRTKTDYGSSGAPVFDSRWQLIAVNQLREPVFDREPTYSQGVPIGAIRDLLRRKGKESIALGGDPANPAMTILAPPVQADIVSGADRQAANVPFGLDQSPQGSTMTAQTSPNGVGEFRSAAPVLGQITGRTFPERDVRFSPIGDLAVFEGDIILGKVQDIVGGGV